MGRGREKREEKSGKKKERKKIGEKMLHEKLICYQRTLEMAGKITEAILKWPNGYGYLSDQAKRAISSALLNCAEGNARRGFKERRRFFQIARVSIAEVSACVDLMLIFRLVSIEHGKLWKDSLKQIGWMLNALK